MEWLTWNKAYDTNEIVVFFEIFGRMLGMFFIFEVSIINYNFDLNSLSSSPLTNTVTSFGMCFWIFRLAPSHGLMERIVYFNYVSVRDPSSH